MLQMLMIYYRQIQLMVSASTPFKSMKKFFPIVFFIFFVPMNAQVGINTTTVSSAAVLHLEAENVHTTQIGGFLMPVVTESEQSNIPVSTLDNRDDGLMVFVSDPVTGKQCWDIYDGIVHTWRSINCLNVTCSGDILFQENFESYTGNTGVSGVTSSSGDYPSGVTKWTLTSFQAYGNSTPALPGTLLDEDDFALVQAGKLAFRDTNGVFQFQTQAIDISGYDNIGVSMEVSTAGILEYDPLKHINDFTCGEIESDYFDLAYSTDGGISYTKITNYSGLGTINHTLVSNLTGTVTVSVSGLSGSSLIIRIRLQTWAADEHYFLDNIIVSCI